MHLPGKKKKKSLNKIFGKRILLGRRLGDLLRQHVSDPAIKIENGCRSLCWSKNPIFLLTSGNNSKS